MTAIADSGPHGARSRLLPLTLTALGVVYGDIGTSPLYALRESFYGSHSVPPSHDNVLGVLSFVLYALILIISIKYIAVVMRADRKSTRLNSSHSQISYAVFCLKKKKHTQTHSQLTPTQATLRQQRLYTP